MTIQERINCGLCPHEHCLGMLHRGWRVSVIANAVCDECDVLVLIWVKA